MLRRMQPADKDLPGFHNVLVTGATSGIGQACAEWLARRGAERIFFCGRDEERLASVAEALRALGADARPERLDVSDAAAAGDWIRRCDAEAPLDLVFANAGMSADGREDDEAVVRRVFAVNVGGVLNTVLPALALYRERPEGRVAKRIAITSSMTGYHGMPQCPAYSASKACVKALGAALRGRVRGEGIAVTTICPGFVRSRITDKNECPMPFFLEAPAAAEIIGRGIERGKGIVSFPWPMRLATWWLSTLPEALSELLFRLLPEKTGAKRPGV